MRPRLAITALFLHAALPAFAGVGEPVRSEGGTVRLAVEDAPRADGTLRGALLIDLKPGWKTYWRDPGEAGIPPTVELDAASDAESVEIGFPPPVRFEDGVGYTQPVALPLTFKIAAGEAPNRLALHVFLGVCEDICIPVDARLSAPLDPTGSVAPPEVGAAFAALPQHAPKDTVRSVVADKTSIALELDRPLGPDDSLFLAAPAGWSLGLPQALPGDPARVSAPILFKPRAEPLSGREVGYTLVRPQGSVEGRFTLP